MARVYHRKAGKDYPQYGIKKGEMYYTADIMTGPRSSRTIRSKTPIPRSQLTTSEFLSTAYDLSDQLDSVDCKEDLETIRQGFEDLGQETQDKLDNMPEGLQQGDTGQLLQERIDQCESLVQEIEQAISDVEEAENSAEDTGDEDSEDESDEEAFDEAAAVRTAIENNVSSTF